MNILDNTSEILRLQAPNELVRHREQEIDLAVPVLKHSIEAMGVVLTPVEHTTETTTLAQRYEAQVKQIASSEAMSPVTVANQEQVADMGLYRAQEQVAAAYEGSGNPLFNYDKKAA